MNAREISPEDLKALLDADQPVILVEVLAARSYRQGRLPGAINLPILAVRHAAADVLPDKSATVVAYCLNARCTSSARAAEMLRQMGYTDVRELQGGKEAWLAAGHALERDAEDHGG